MAPSRTSTVKSKHASKHAANKSGIRNSKNSTKPTGDGVSKPKSANSKRTQSKGAPQKIKGTSNLATLKKKRRVYTEKELNIPALNMITPIGVEKPKGKKKGKVFVDDRVSQTWIFRLLIGKHCGDDFYIMLREGFWLCFFSNAGFFSSEKTTTVSEQCKLLSLQTIELGKKINC